MGVVVVKVLEPFAGYPGTEGDFLTLDEAKQLLGMSTAPDPATDDLLRLQISIQSATIMRLCNRVFARERLIESWHSLAAPTVFLTHFPVAEADIETVETAPTYELDERSGMLMGFGGFTSPVRITYSGGYALPDEAPLDLKYATSRMLSNSRGQASRDAVEGIRMIAHKESRVIYFDPNQQTAKAATSSGSLGSGLKDVDELLMRYVRIQA